MYTVEEIEALIDAQRPGEGLAEIESRLGHAWRAQQKRDGVSREEIIRQVVDLVDSCQRGNQAVQAEDEQQQANGIQGKAEGVVDALHSGSDHGVTQNGLHHGMARVVDPFAAAGKEKAPTHSEDRKIIKF